MLNCHLPESNKSGLIWKSLSIFCSEFDKGNSFEINKMSGETKSQYNFYNYRQIAIFHILLKLLFSLVLRIKQFFSFLQHLVTISVTYFLKVGSNWSFIQSKEQNKQFIYMLLPPLGFEPGFFGTVSYDAPHSVTYSTKNYFF